MGTETHEFTRCWTGGICRLAFGRRIENAEEIVDGVDSVDEHWYMVDAFEIAALISMGGMCILAHFGEGNPAEALISSSSCRRNEEFRYPSKVDAAEAALEACVIVMRCCV